MDVSEIPPMGAIVRIELKDIFGESVYIDGKILSEPYQHGFDYDSGSWGLYDLSNKGYKCSPCFKVQVKPKGKRNPIILNVKDMLSLEGAQI